VFEASEIKKILPLWQIAHQKAELMVAEDAVQTHYHANC
jgi:hypothetical protein